jgi:hypothetical protein
MSAISGTFDIVDFPLARRDAHNIGSVAFFDPLTVISPLSFLPPLMMNFAFVEFMN